MFFKLKNNGGSMTRGTKLIIGLWSLVLVGFYLVSRSSSEADRSSTAERTMRSDGDGRYPITVRVGSTTVVDPLHAMGVDWLWDQKRLRSISLENPGTVDLYVGTYSAFIATAAAWFVPKNSGTWTTWNHATFYLLVGPDGGSVTVRGVVEYDNQVNTSSPSQRP